MRPKGEKKIYTREALRHLKKLYPHATIALRFSNNWELLVAVILSAQCTDKKVNEVTARLFKKYKTLDDYVRVRPKEFENRTILLIDDVATSRATLEEAAVTLKKAGARSVWAFVIAKG